MTEDSTLHLAPCHLASSFDQLEATCQVVSVPGRGLCDKERGGGGLSPTAHEEPSPSHHLCDGACKLILPQPSLQMKPHLDGRQLLSEP